MAKRQAAQHFRQTAKSRAVRSAAGDAQHVKFRQREMLRKGKQLAGDVARLRPVAGSAMLDPAPIGFQCWPLEYVAWKRGGAAELVWIAPVLAGLIWARR